MGCLADEAPPACGSEGARVGVYGWNISLLREVVLAPSSHNTQPWRFRAVGDDTIELYADRSRQLTVVDPAGRELVISCGAALYYLRLALRHRGARVAVDKLPEPAEPDRLARVRVTGWAPPSEEEEALFAAIPSRHTDRRPFAPRPIEAAVLDALRDAARAEGACLRLIEEPATERQVAEMVAEGDRLQGHDPAFRQEAAAWLHANDDGRRDGMPGSVFGVPTWLSHLGPAVLRFEPWWAIQPARDRDLCLHAPVLGVVTTADDTPSGWLSAGQALARLLLRGQRDGVAASFLNQPIEVPELRQRLEALLGRGLKPQLLLRLGYSDRPAHWSPRRSVWDVLAP